MEDIRKSLIDFGLDISVLMGSEMCVVFEGVGEREGINLEFIIETETEGRCNLGKSDHG
jgi:hypothetical protein